MLVRDSYRTLLVCSVHTGDLDWEKQESLQDEKKSYIYVQNWLSRGVAPEVNLRILLYAGDKALNWRDPACLWNPRQTSPEVQNRGISGPQKGDILEKLTNKNICAKRRGKEKVASLIVVGVCDTVQVNPEAPTVTHVELFFCHHVKCEGPHSLKVKVAVRLSPIPRAQLKRIKETCLVRLMSFDT